MLMFQTGYLTVNKRLPYPDGEFDLKFPNSEVKTGFLRVMTLPKNTSKRLEATLLKVHSKAILEALFVGNEEQMKTSFESFLNIIPYDNVIAHEGFFKVIFHHAVIMLDKHDVYFEEHTSDGRIDVRISDPKYGHFILEFKYVSTNNTDFNDVLIDNREDRLKQEIEKKITDALQQIKERKYSAKFQTGENNIYHVAVVISGHSDVDIKIEKVPPPKS
jgi:hypothetical protein